MTESRTRLSREELVEHVRQMDTPITSPSEPHVVVPEWMTSEQVAAISALYARNPDGSPTQAHFFNRVSPYIGGYCGLRWCGMFIGIEKDGYTHS